MPFVKSSKKQASMPGPNSAAYRKLLATQQTTVAPAPAPKSEKKSSRVSTFTSLKSRQRIVERVKRAIWAKVLEINDAIINLALCGNYSAAKALFDFAGVYSLPMPDGDAAAFLQPDSAPATSLAANTAPHDPVQAFFRSIGVEPPIDEPASAAQSL